MLPENGPTRRYTAERAASAGPARAGLLDEADLRQISAIVGDDSPLRPGRAGSLARANLEFSSTLGRLGDAFQQVRGSLQELDEKVEAVRAAAARISGSVDSLHDRLTFEDARAAQLESRLIDLETKHAATLDLIQGRVVALRQQVAIALGMSMAIGALGVAALIVGR